MGLPWLAFAATLSAALIHASWNAAARHAKGQLVVSIAGFLVGLALLTPPAAVEVVLRHGEGLRSTSGWAFCALSAALHALYIILLNTAYRSGELSVVYPVARGTGVATATLLAGLWVGEDVNPPAYMGVSLVLLGIVLVSICRATENTVPTLSSEPNGIQLDADAVECEAAASCARLEEPPEGGEACDGDEQSDRPDEELSPRPSVQFDTVLPSEESPEAAPMQGDARHTGSRQGHALATAMATGVTIGTYSIVDKLGVSDMPPIFYLWAMLLMELVMLIPIRKPLGLSWAGLCEALRTQTRAAVAIGAGGMTAYGLVLWAMTQGHATYIVALRESSVVFGAILGWTLFRERFTLLKAVGVALVISGVVAIRALS
eukprot:TRINITY_DN60067_c0_g1_i1.p1 TRINITY_DN60067_c0_g1~~TRINITY_DN60067_c0_g1_i1.p1  ORF type:complete len:376 (+),score=83.04 TRINITY_DN60067_c0_g1_i1:88-1215(+)